MKKLQEVVNAVAETIMMHAADVAENPDRSVLAGATLDLEASNKLQEQGFVLQLTDGLRFEVRISPVD